MQSRITAKSRPFQSLGRDDLMEHLSHHGFGERLTMLPDKDMRIAPTNAITQREISLQGGHRGGV